MLLKSKDIGEVRNLRGTYPPQERTKLQNN